MVYVMIYHLSVIISQLNLIRGLMLNVVICDDSTRDASPVRTVFTFLRQGSCRNKTIYKSTKMLERLTKDTHCVFGY